MAKVGILLVGFFWCWGNWAAEFVPEALGIFAPANALLGKSIVVTSDLIAVGADDAIGDRWGDFHF
jgi:hypothetical protein